MRATVWFGWVCGVVAVMLLAVWLIGPWFINFAAVSRNGYLGAWLVGGRLDLHYAAEPALHLVYHSTPRGYTAGTHAEPRLFNGVIPRSASFDERELVMWQWRSNIEGELAWLPDVLVEPRTEVWHLRVPLWCVAAVFACVPVIGWARGRGLIKWRRAGRCPACNYSRAGISAAAVCPECGKAS